MISYTTFQDVIDHGFDYLGGNPSDQVRRDCVRASLEAYRDLANAFNWSYLYTHSRIYTSGCFDGSQTGATIQYQQSSGVYERMVTISGGTWPTWAGDGTYMRVASGDTLTSGDVTGFVAYRVDQMKSSTVLTLTEALNPETDIPAGTQFMLYRDTYLLPEDYIAQDQSLFERNFGGMTFTHPREWLYENRYVFAQGVPQFYTITGDQQYPGRLVMRIFPWPYESKSIDFIYKRRPQAILLQKNATGSVAGTIGLNALVGTSTTLTPGMVGSVIRLGADLTTAPPTSLIMGNPPVFESYITSWVDATHITIEDPLNQTYAAAPIIISDMLDIEQGAMLNAYLRCVEKHLGMSRTLKDKPSASKQYDQALSEAKAADSRSFTGRSVGQNTGLRLRLRDYPIDLSRTH